MVHDGYLFKAEKKNSKEEYYFRKSWLNYLIRLIPFGIGLKAAFGHN